MVDVRFYMDPDNPEPHLRRHGITEDEATEVVLAPTEDRPGFEGSRVAIGQTPSGRYLRVIYVPDPDGNGIFVITAYELTGSPLAAFKRRRRRKR